MAHILKQPNARSPIVSSGIGIISLGGKFDILERPDPPIHPPVVFPLLRCQLFPNYNILCPKMTLPMQFIH